VEIVSRLRRSRTDKTQPHGRGCDADTGLGAQLGLDVGDVDRGGFAADEQLLADLTIGATGCNQLENLSLARTQIDGDRLPASFVRPPSRPRCLVNRASPSTPARLARS